MAALDKLLPSLELVSVTAPLDVRAGSSMVRGVGALPGGTHHVDYTNQALSRQLALTSCHNVLREASIQHASCYWGGGGGVWGDRPVAARFVPGP